MIVKPFRGFLPVPILPAAQVQATSYEQHLAYIEWYLNYLAGAVNSIVPGTAVEANPELDGGEDDLDSIEIAGTKYAIPSGGGAAAAPEILEVYGLLSAPLTDSEAVALSAGYSSTDKITLDSGKVKFGAGVNHVRVTGYVSLYYTGTAAVCSAQMRKSGVTQASTVAYVNSGVDAVDYLVVPDHIRPVSEGDVWELFLTNMHSTFSSMQATPRIIIEVLD